MIPKLAPWLSSLLLAAPLSAADYYVDPVAGDDVLGLGTSASPWKSIRFALTHATSGDVVHAAPGTYSTATGEVFPLVILEGVQVIGAGIGQTILHGTGGTTSTLLHARTAQGLSDFPSISHATLRNAAYGALVPSTPSEFWSLRITDVRFENVGTAAAAENSDFIRLDRCEVVGATRALSAYAQNFEAASVDFYDGVIESAETAGYAFGYLGGTAWIFVVGSRIEGCATGLLADQRGSVEVDGSLVTGCGTAFTSVGLSTVVIRRSTVTANDVGIATIGLDPWLHEIWVNGSIVRGNASTNLDPAYVWNSSYSDTSPVLPGVGCVDVDPLFVDPSQGDWHLSAASPLIDAGAPGGPFFVAVDGDGDPRVLDGDLSGAARLDVGWDEYNAVRLTAPASASPGAALPFAVDAPAGFASALFGALATADVPVGAFGSLLLAPAGAFPLGAAPAPWSGALPVPAAIPTGLVVHLQAVALDLAGGVGSVSNRASVAIE